MASGDIEWYLPERGINSLESHVSHMDGTRKAVYGKATGMAREAAAALAAHHRKGNAHINVTAAPPRKLDSYVELRDEDPGGEGKAGKNKGDRSAMSIEFGWTQTHAFGKKLEHPIHHDGLHILGNVMNRAAGRYRGGNRA